MLASEWTRPEMLSHFTVVRKLEDGLFPMGFNKEAVDKNSKAGSTIISMESRQVVLSNCLFVVFENYLLSVQLLTFFLLHMFAVKELY